MEVTTVDRCSLLDKRIYPLFNPKSFESNLWPLLLPVNDSRSEQNPIWLWLFIPPGDLALYLTLSSRETDRLWGAKRWLQSTMTHTHFQLMQINANIQYILLHFLRDHTIQINPGSALLPHPLMVDWSWTGCWSHSPFLLLRREMWTTLEWLVNLN